MLTLSSFTPPPQKIHINAYSYSSLLLYYSSKINKK